MISIVLAGMIVSTIVGVMVYYLLKIAVTSETDQMYLLVILFCCSIFMNYIQSESFRVQEIKPEKVEQVK